MQRLFATSLLPAISHAVLHCAVLYYTTLYATVFVVKGSRTTKLEQKACFTNVYPRSVIALVIAEPYTYESVSLLLKKRLGVLDWCKCF